MIIAKNNIIVKIQNSRTPEYAILNPVSGSFDLMDQRDFNIYQKINEGENLDNEFSSYLLERGYAFKNLEEMDTSIDKAYIDFKTEISKSQVQLMLVPTYGCNLACTYCFQHGIEEGPSLISKETVDAFFEYAKANFSNGSVKPFITLFGGEPLQNSPKQRSIIEYIVDKTAEVDYEIAAVTNGYDFIEYVEILKKVKIKEIQFTLDGSREIHDTRRATANKKGTFDRIIQGIEAAVKNKIPVNLRSVVDMENIKDIVNLAEFLDKKGWLDLPPELFKTQIGRNYELFDCYAKPQHLMTQLQLWGEFASLSKSYPVLAKFHRPDFKGIRHLVDTGELYMASFDTCPACKTEWVFDLYGNIYGCTASCGREEYLLGTYWPQIDLNKESIKTWQTRDVKSISKCMDCKYDVICGGGCGVVAANQNNGNIHSPDCRPIYELLETGINYYIDDIHQMAGENESTKTEGCIICGNELLYSANNPTKETCNICSREFETHVKCSNGHYICDSCHNLDILSKVERLLTASNESNPVILAQKVFELPGLNMHGPEYHSIVPAVLVAAYQNLSWNKDTSKIKEALSRGKDIKGGSCGFHGVCGAAAGSGITVSIIEGATPMSKDQRGAASKATGYALLEISKYGGPRCCKREAMTTIESFIKVTEYFNNLQYTKYSCNQYHKNKDCLGVNCPYFPDKQNA